jgi:hypothetical protein
VIAGFASVVAAASLGVVLAVSGGDDIPAAPAVAPAAVSAPAPATVPAPAPEPVPAPVAAPSPDAAVPVAASAPDAGVSISSNPPAQPPTTKVGSRRTERPASTKPKTRSARDQLMEPE